MTTDPVAFLRARLDEEEQIALGACWCSPADVPGVAAWSVEATHHDAWPFMVFNDLDDRVAQTCAENTDNESVARHIARHDPARTLREVEAKRGVVKVYERACDHYAVFTSGFAVAMEDVLRMFAVAYDDHPDFEESWRP